MVKVDAGPMASASDDDDDKLQDDESKHRVFYPSLLPASFCSSAIRFAVDHR